MKIKTKILVMAVLGSIFATYTGGQTTTKRARSQSVTVRISATSFSPENIRLHHGIPTRITFLRTTDATCAKEIVIPSYSISRSLPLNQPTAVNFTPRRTGNVTFACAMDMMRGTLIVR